LDELTPETSSVPPYYFPGHNFLYFPFFSIGSSPPFFNTVPRFFFWDPPLHVYPPSFCFFIRPLTVLFSCIKYEMPSLSSSFPLIFSFSMALFFTESFSLSSFVDPADVNCCHLTPIIPRFFYCSRLFCPLHRPGSDFISASSCLVLRHRPSFCSRKNFVPAWCRCVTSFSFPDNWVDFFQRLEPFFYALSQRIAFLCFLWFLLSFSSSLLRDTQGREQSVRNGLVFVRRRPAPCVGVLPPLVSSKQ